MFLLADSRIQLRISENYKGSGSPNIKYPNGTGSGSGTLLNGKKIKRTAKYDENQHKKRSERQVRGIV